MRAVLEKMAVFSIQQKLWGGFAIVLLILVVVVTTTLSSLSDTETKANRMTREVQPTLIASMKLMTTLQETSKSLGFFLLTKEAERKAEYLAYLNKLDAALAELKATPAAQLNEGIQTQISEIESDVNTFKAYKDQMIELTAEINNNFLAVRHASETMNPINSQFFQIISTMLLSEDEQELSADRKALTKDITNLRYAWSNITNNARIFLTFGSEEILQNINLFAESAQKLIQRIKDKGDILTFEEEEGIGQLEPLRSQWMEHLKQLVEIHRGAKARMDAYMLRTEIGPLLKRVDDNLKQLIKQQQDAIENTGTALIGQAAATHQLVVILLVVGLLAGLLVSWGITAMITRPLQAAAHAMHDIAAGDGDLTQRLNAKGRDELAQLAQSFNHFIEKIQHIIQQVTQSTEHMTKATENMTNATATTTDITEKQKSETDQAATAVTEMSATAHDVAQNAELAASAANSANQQTTEGRRIVNRALDGIYSMGESIQKNADIVEQLGKDISDITSIIDAIQGIAEQTNLLALNAAIEAARAGEQGRGFAVVADEVRTLATRTKQSTQDIQDKVRALQTLASHVVESILENRENAKTTIDLATDAGSSLDAITQAVGSITEMVEQIASAAEEQSAVAETVNQGIVNINQLADGIFAVVDRNHNRTGRHNLLTIYISNTIYGTQVNRIIA